MTRPRTLIALLAAAIAGSLLGVAGLAQPHNDEVLPTTLPGVATQAPQPTATVVSSPSGDAARSVVFTREVTLARGEGDCTDTAVRRWCVRVQLWIGSADGTDLRELFPDRPGSRSPVAWLPDGRLWFKESTPDGTAFLTTDARGSAPIDLDVDLNAACPSCIEGAVPPVSVSADGTRLAYLRDFAWPTGDVDRVKTAVIAVLDRSTGAVRPLDATTTYDSKWPGFDLCADVCNGGGLGMPRWSPGGDRLVFSRSEGFDPRTMSGPTVLRSSLQVIGRDGTGLATIVPYDLWGTDPQWSPDGSVIAFTSAAERLVVNPVSGERDLVRTTFDVFTIRPDGSDLRRLTDDGISQGAVWTTDGALVYQRITVDDGNMPIDFEVWRMGADGSDKRALDATDLETLTGAGCIECPYIVDPAGPTNALWQPPS